MAMAWVPAPLRRVRFAVLACGLHFCMLAALVGVGMYMADPEDGTPRILTETKHDHPQGDMFSYHKPLWPLDRFDYLTLGFTIIGLIVAAGGGIGGGGILVPIFLLVLGFRPKHTIALSNFTIFGGSIANTIFNVQKAFPDGRGYIDWDIILIMEPATIAGAVLGSFASKFLPDFVLCSMLAIILGLLATNTLGKGIKMYQKENEQAELEDDDDGGVLMETTRDSESSSGSSSEQEECCPAAIPWSRVGMLFLCFSGCVVLTILKGSGHGSVIGVECGSWLFWVLGMGNVPWVMLFGFFFRSLLMTEYEDKVAANHKFQENELRWDSRSTIVYPLICSVSGIFAGLFGVGGGIVKGPLMLEMGVHPAVAAATAATMIFFTSLAACVSFIVFGLLEFHYGVCGFVLGLVCTAIGQYGTNIWMKAAKRQSPPVLSIGTVLVLSAFLVGVEAISKYIEKKDSWQDLFQMSSICSTTS